MGPVTIAVDSYGPVTTSQSVYSSPHRGRSPTSSRKIKKEFGFEPDYENAKVYLE
jgi:K(+)-stimulated pyrophosphate-energized sodium pump